MSSWWRWVWKRVRPIGNHALKHRHKKGLENQGQNSFIQAGNRWKSMKRTLHHYGSDTRGKEFLLSQADPGKGIEFRIHWCWSSSRKINELAQGVKDNRVEMKGDSWSEEWRLNLLNFWRLRFGGISPYCTYLSRFDPGSGQMDLGKLPPDILKLVFCFPFTIFSKAKGSSHRVRIRRCLAPVGRSLRSNPP